VKTVIDVASIGLEDQVFEAGGIARRLRVFRLPDENPARGLRAERRIKLADLGTTRSMCARPRRTAI